MCSLSCLVCAHLTTCVCARLRGNIGCGPIDGILLFDDITYVKSNSPSGTHTSLTVRLNVQPLYRCVNE